MRSFSQAIKKKILREKSKGKFMMKTKKDLYKEIRRGFEEMHPDLAELQVKYDALQSKMKDGHYSQAAYLEFAGEKKKLAEEIRGLKKDLSEIISKKAAETIGDIESSNVLNGADLTADVKLFNLGVDLSKDDVLHIMKRNPENITILQLAQKYLDQKGMLDSQAAAEIKSAFPVLTNFENDIEDVNRAATTCKMILSNYPAPKYVATGEYETRVVTVNGVEKVTRDPIIELVPPDLYTKYIGPGSEMYNSLYGDNSEERSNEE